MQNLNDLAAAAGVGIAEPLGRRLTNYRMGRGNLADTSRWLFQMFVQPACDKLLVFVGVFRL